MLNPFDGLAVAGQATEYLAHALESGGVTHAYLIAGPKGCGSAEVAKRFAAAVVAGQDRAEFEVALRGAHPDVHELHPASATGYLVEQVREAVHDTTLAPVRSTSKVYILHKADRMSGAPANAFLKTLEEPPAGVVIILLAATEQSVLQTLRSRCQVLAMPALANGDADDVSAAQSHELQSEVNDIMAELAQGMGNIRLLETAKRLVELGSQGIEELKEEHAAKEAEGADYLTAGARKALAESHKREVSMRQREGLLELISCTRSWLRGLLLASQGVSSQEEPATAATAAAPTDAAGVISALDAAARCEKRISYNVTPQLAMEAMLLEIREALCPR